jgi:branched-chain amino acid transport system ATP-binding protein
LIVGAEKQGQSLLTVEQVSVSFGGLRALSDVSFNVEENEIVSLIGPNGAGKTTAFNLITGFIRSYDGSIRYRGTRLNGLKSHVIAGLGLVRTFQRTSVFPNHTVFQNVLMGLHRSSQSTLLDTVLALPREAASERVLADEASQILQAVGLTSRATELAGSLPYGEQRLVGVALALAVKPSMLLLDEPVSGMNPAETARFMKLVDTVRSQGITILLVEHDMRMVMGVSDRVIVLNNGQVIAQGTPSEVQRNPEVVRAYLGRAASHA